MKFTRYLALSLAHLIPVEVFIGWVAETHPHILPIRIDFVNYCYMIVTALVGLYHWKDKILDILLTRAMARVKKELQDEEFRENLSTVAGDAVVEALTGEIEVADASGNKTTMKVPAYLAATMTDYFYMRFLGDKGNLSKELKGMEKDALIQSIPPEYQGLAAQFMPLLQKYKSLGAFVALGQMMAQQKGRSGVPSLQSPNGHSLSYYG